MSRVMSHPAAARPLDGHPDEVVGNALPVRTIDGGTRPYAYLDNAASTPALHAVQEAVNAFLPHYSSVHRGSGYKSRVATAAYDAARDTVLRSVGARPDQTAIFTKNTTEGLNRIALLAQDRDAVVFTSTMEHHANLLPWRLGERAVSYFEVDDSGVVDEDDLARQLARSSARRKLVAIAGAYNVTGYAPPIHRIASIAHQHGAEIVVDAAQLAPHRRVDMRGRAPGEEIDYLVFSAHKIYAPFGSGVLVAPDGAFDGTTPAVVGGGIVELVLLNEVFWKTVPDREEAGSPNVVGAVALAAALHRLDELGREELEAEEQSLTEYLLTRLLAIPRVQVLGPPDPRSRVGVVSFNIVGRDHDLVAAALAYEHGIGVRSGCFCAHPGLFRLLGVGEATIQQLRETALRPRDGGDRSLRIVGAVRASLGLQNTRTEVDRFVTAVAEIAMNGPAAKYEISPAGDHVPVGWHDDPPPDLGPLLGSRWS